jgi:hypothetical protein
VFLDRLREALYDPFHVPSNRYVLPPPESLRAENRTLGAVADLITSAPPGSAGVRSVISYTYDNLLEYSLGGFPARPGHSARPVEGDGLPVYHVHGYVLSHYEGGGSTGDEIVFTEDQYHLLAQNVYSWSNIVQIKELSSSVGLIIGLSLVDRNMRRLLDAVKNAPVGSRNYALIGRPEWKGPNDCDLDEIHQEAIRLYNKFVNSGVKRDLRKDEATYQQPGVKRATIKSRPDTHLSPGRKEEPVYRSEIRCILHEVELFARDEQAFVFEQLGIRPIFLDGYQEIRDILAAISR